MILMPKNARMQQLVEPPRSQAPSCFSAWTLGLPRKQVKTVVTKLNSDNRNAARRILLRLSSYTCKSKAATSSIRKNTESASFLCLPSNSNAYNYNLKTQFKWHIQHRRSSLRKLVMFLDSNIYMYLKIEMISYLVDDEWNKSSVLPATNSLRRLRNLSSSVSMILIDCLWNTLST